MRDITRDVYRRGNGPAVIIMHELPGITPQVELFAREVAEAGFTVAMPCLFGTPGRPLTRTYLLGEIVRACINREYYLLAAHKTSPITDWLRALACRLYREIGGRGVGAIGMCLTGNFALALALDPWLMAPVLSQPSLPVPIGKARREAVHLSAPDLTRIKRRVREEGLCVLGLRFRGDPMCPPERFSTLRRELEAGFEAIEIAPEYGNPMGNKPPHSVVTTELVNKAGEPTRVALDRVLSFFGERLK